MTRPALASVTETSLDLLWAKYNMYSKLKLKPHKTKFTPAVYSVPFKATPVNQRLVVMLPWYPQAGSLVEFVAPILRTSTPNGGPGEACLVSMVPWPGPGWEGTFLGVFQL